MMKTARLVGSAGSGKTTELLSVMESAKAALGGSPFAVGFASLTRAARAEAVARASAAWGIPPDVLSRDGWFKTAHGVAHKMLGIQKGQLIDDTKASATWVANALKVDVRVILDDDSGYAMYAGDKAAADSLNCWEISRARVEPLQETVKRMARCGQSPPTFAECRQFIKRYEDAKRLEERCDFSDLLARYAGIRFEPDGFFEVEPEGPLPPGVKAWIFDEAQDASALVDRVCKRLAHGPEVVWAYLAGDPFQCQPAGTPVLTAKGYRAIEDLDPETDWLIAFNKREGRFYGTGGGVRFQKAWRDVDSGELIEVTFADGTKSVCTSNHKWVVRTARKATCLIGSKECRFVQAESLLPGLHSAPKLLGTVLAEWVEVVSARRLQPGETVRVYSLEVERHHTYVTTNGIVTGNSIFGFGGSDYRHFMSWPVDKERVMPRSWRCPKPVLELGEKCLKQMKRGYWDRGVAPADHDGEVVRGGFSSAIVPKLDPLTPTLIIARCNYTLDDWSDELKKRGVPFAKLKSKDNTALLRGIQALWDLERGEPVSGDDFACAVEELPSRAAEGPLMVRGAKTLWKKDETKRRYDAVFPSMLAECGMTVALEERIRSGKWGDLVTGGERWRKAAIKYGPELATKPHIRLGTIHAAKGMEADVVVLSTDTSRRIHEAQAIDPEQHDEERRIEYVGVTRARRKLIIASSTADYRMNVRA